MKLFDIAWKEISLIKSQRIALLLIVLYPLLVVGLIGSAFTGLDITEMKENKIGIVNELSFYPDFLEKFISLKELSIIEYPSAEALTNAIKTKEIVTGLRLTGTSKYSQIKVELFYDNSSLLASKFFVEIAKAMMQRITSDLSQQELGRVWAIIAELGSSVDKENTNISDFKSKLLAADTSLNNLEADLNALDFAEIEGALSDQRSTVSDFNTKNTAFRQQINSFKSSFNTTKQRISDINMQVSSYVAELNSIYSQIDSVNALISASIAGLITLSDSMQDPVSKAALDTQIASLNEANSTLSNVKSMASNLASLSNELSNSGSSLNQSISQADALFISVERESNDISQALGSSSNTISSMNSKLSVFKSSIDEVKQLIDESRISKAEIESRLAESSVLLSSFEEEIATLKDIDPAVLAKPAVFYEHKIFAVDPLGILVSNSASVVLILACMLLSSLLIILEKNQNVSLRFSLSTTSKTVLLFGKIIGQLVIAWIETAIILSVAFIKIPLPNGLSIGFGLITSTSIFDIFIAVTIISIAFISLGLLISFFTKNQSTAILASLLVVVPMLFLSGIILPIEFMEPFMQAISSLLPLTVANNILVGLIVKGELLAELLIALFGLIIFSAVIIIALLLKKD